MENNKRIGELVTIDQLSKCYSIPLSTLRRWASERRFPLFKISNRIRVSVEDFEIWLRAFKIDNSQNKENGRIENEKN